MSLFVQDGADRAVGNSILVLQMQDRPSFVWGIGGVPQRVASDGQYERLDADRHRIEHYLTCISSSNRVCTTLRMT
jgi:hypothetical protein